MACVSSIEQSSVAGRLIIIIRAAQVVPLADGQQTTGGGSVGNTGFQKPSVDYLPPVPTKEAASYFPVGPVPFDKQAAYAKKTPPPPAVNQKVFIPNPWIKGQCLGERTAAHAAQDHHRQRLRQLPPTPFRSPSRQHSGPRSQAMRTASPCGYRRYTYSRS